MLEFRIEKILHISHVTAISHIPAQSACFRVTSGVSRAMNLFAAAVLTKLFCARCVLTADEPKLGLDQEASAIGVTTSVPAEVNAVEEKPNMRRVKEGDTFSTGCRTKKSDDAESTTSETSHLVAESVITKTVKDAVSKHTTTKITSHRSPCTTASVRVDGSGGENSACEVLAAVGVRSRSMFSNSCPKLTFKFFSLVVHQSLRYSRKKLSSV